MVGIRRPSAVWGGFPLYLTDVGHDAMAALGVRRGKAAFFSGSPEEMREPLIFDSCWFDNLSQKCRLRVNSGHFIHDPTRNVRSWG